MVLPISTCAPDVPAVTVGVLVSLLSEPQAATPSVAAAMAQQARTRAERMSGRYPVDAVDHAQFAAAVPHHRIAALVEDRLVAAVDDDVVDDVVGDHDVGRTLYGYREAAAQCVDSVAGAVD